MNGDYNQSQASEVVQEEKVISNALQEWQRLGSNLKTIVFACDIAHAEKLRAEFIKMNISACCVHSNMSQSKNLIFKHNNYQVLINVDMATFGFDEPSIECMLFAAYKIFIRWWESERFNKDNAL